MNKPLVYGVIAVSALGAGLLIPVAANALGGYNHGNVENSQAVRARDGSGDGTPDRLHTETQDRLYIHQEDGTCDGTGDGDGTGAQQRQHGRQ